MANWPDRARVTVDGVVQVAQVGARRTPNGLVAAAASGILVAAPADLLSVKIRYAGAGTNFVMLFDAAVPGDIGNARLLLGSGYPVSAASRDLVVEFLYEVRCAFGAAYAVSSTPTTYTAVAQAAVVAAQWR